jgi:hypothetical protein
MLFFAILNHFVWLSFPDLSNYGFTAGFGNFSRGADNPAPWPDNPAPWPDNPAWYFFSSNFPKLLSII